MERRENMATEIRSELSKKNPYYISKHRYYELKHFCLQYPEWRSKYKSLEFQGIPYSPYAFSRLSDISDPTAKLALIKTIYSDRMDMVEECARQTDEEIGPYIQIAVCEGCTYDKLNARLYVPCGRKKFYELYRRFFYILDKERR